MSILLVFVYFLKFGSTQIFSFSCWGNFSPNPTFSKSSYMCSEVYFWTENIVFLCGSILSEGKQAMFFRKYTFEVTVEGEKSSSFLGQIAIQECNILPSSIF